jgi:hypothetical protein
MTKCNCDMDDEHSMVTAFAVYLSDGFIMELAKRLKERGIKDPEVTHFRTLTGRRKIHILKKALEVLDREEVLLEMFYDSKYIYGRIIREILQEVGDETREEIIKNCKDIGIEKIIPEKETRSCDRNDNYIS